MQELGGREQLGDAVERVAELPAVGERSHGDARIGRVAGDDGGEPDDQGLDDLLLDLLGRQDPAHGGALLPGLLGDLPRHVRDEAVEGGRTGRDVGGEHRGIEAVGLDVEAHARLGERRPPAQGERRRGRTGESDDVLRPQPVEQVAGRADDELQSAFRKQARFDGDLDHPVVTSAVAVAGLVIVGTPARKAQANFSANPHAGKLKALMWMATPWRGTRAWADQKFSALAERGGPRHRRSTRRPAERDPQTAVVGERTAGAVDVEGAVGRCTAVVGR